MIRENKVRPRSFLGGIWLLFNHNVQRTNSRYSYRYYNCLQKLIVSTVKNKAVVLNMFGL